jgi:threonine/homoserine/homoserine lactone efflux protein
MTGGIVGGVFHTISAAVCVGVLTTLLASAFTTILLLAGATYMKWIGWKLVNSSITVSSLGSDGSASMRQALVLGLITIMTQALVYNGLALGAAKSRDALTGYPRVTMWIGRWDGAVFLAVAAFTVARVGVG